MGDARTVDVLIIGAGFAGAATAFHLSRSFSGSILIIDKEAAAGAHASGRNASLLLQSVADPAIRQAAAASRAAYGELRQQIGFQEVGSILLGTEQQLAEVYQPELVASHRRSLAWATERVPLLAGHVGTAALETPGDGVLDPRALLGYYLEQAQGRGVELCCGCELQSLEPGRPHTVLSNRGVIEARYVIDAAGAWASQVGAWARSTPQELQPRKRHLFVLDDVPSHADSSRWPFVWSLEHDFYFRPESGGWLFSICDEERDAPLQETISPGIEDALAVRIAQQLPSFQKASVRQVWSCFRTHSADGRFLIGPDPEVEGFFWVAGLGGHGLGCSWEIGRLAAAAFLGTEAPRAFDPKRLLAPVAATASGPATSRELQTT